MSDIEIGIKGIVETLKKFDKVMNQISEGGLVAKAAYTIERQAKINATRRPGPRVRLDRLRSSIVTDIISVEKAKVAPNVFYAPFVEFGHRQHPGQFVPPLGLRLVADFAPAYPFMEPTIEQTRDDIKGVFVSFGKQLEDDFR